MTYDPTRQFRCDIIRSRTLKLTEDILPIYAQIIHDLCPCSKDEFTEEFNGRLSIYLKALNQPADKKALDNHRTEVSGKLFGMHYEDDQGIENETERAQKFLKDNDQPAFFKDVCYKMQFPSGMKKKGKLDSWITAKINCYPCRLVLAVLQEAQTSGITLTVNDVGYYVLNSLDALSGKVEPSDIIKYIENDRNANITRTITAANGSYEWQHITGLLHYLYLANLIEYSESRSRKRSDKEITLNVREAATINIFVSGNNDPLEFDIYDVPRETQAERKSFQLKWDKYNGELSKKSSKFYTLPSCLGIAATVPNVPRRRASVTAAIGKAGESYVENYEKNQLSKINPAYQSRVINKADQRGLGYDIESAEVIGNNLSKKYIEVKTTTRVTPPASSSSFIDVVNLTRNEMKAAYTYSSAFYVYRVYLTKGGVHIYQLKDIANKRSQNLVDIDAPKYEMKFDLSTPGVVDKEVTV